VGSDIAEAGTLASVGTAFALAVAYIAVAVADT
jgi:hypothetical protein